MSTCVTDSSHFLRPIIPVEPSNSYNLQNGSSPSPRRSRSQPNYTFDPNYNSSREIASTEQQVDVKKKNVATNEKTADAESKSKQTYMEVGLENLGNTCFMNSSLQCLLHIQPLVSYFLATDIDKVLNERSPMKGLLASSFGQLVREYFYASPGSTVAPLDFQKVVGYHAPHLLDNQQQDCQEFLRFLLDGMSEDLCRRRISNRNTQKLSTKSISKRLVISSRTREKVISEKVISGSCIPPNEPSEICHPNRIRRSSSCKLSNRSYSSHLSNDNDNSNNNNNNNNEDDANNDKRDNDDCINGDSEENGIAFKSKSEQTTELNNGPNAGNFPEWFTNAPSSSGLQTNKNQLEEDGVLPDIFSPANGNCVNNNDNEDNNGNNNDNTNNADPSENINSHDPKDSSSYDQNISRSSSAGARMRFKLPNILKPRNSNTEKRRNSIGSKNKGSTSLILSPGVNNLSSIDGPETEGVDTPSKHRIISTPTKMMAMAMGRIKSKETTPSTVDSSFNNSHKDIKHSDIMSAISPEVQLMNKKVAREESRKAWNSYLTLNDSVVTDIFAGQLQSTIECLTCRNKSFCFDPFLDLSVPIPKGKDIRGNWRRSTTVIEPTTCPLEECIEKFTGEEILDDDNMFTCSKCMEKRKCTKKLSIYKYPRVLVIHIKRFRYSEVSREKLSTDVMFPLRGFDLTPYLSCDREPWGKVSNNGITIKSPTLGEPLAESTPSTETKIAPETNTPRINMTVSMDNQILKNDTTNYHLDNDVISSNLQKQDLNTDCTGNTQDQHFISENRPSLASISPSLNIPGGSPCETKFEANLFPPIYDLLGVSNHCGTMNGGHYIAHVDTNAGIKCYRKHRRSDIRCDEGDIERSNIRTEEGDSELDGNSATFNDFKHSDTNNGEGERDDDARWMCFNDEHVTSASTANIIGPSAYVLFYRLREVE